MQRQFSYLILGNMYYFNVCSSIFYGEFYLFVEFRMIGIDELMKQLKFKFIYFDVRRGQVFFLEGDIF